MNKYAVRLLIFTGIYVLASGKFCQPMPDLVPPEGAYCDDSSFVRQDSGVAQVQDSLEINIGLSGQQTFQALSDGDSLELISGGQGATMVIYDLQVKLSTPTDSLCVGVSQANAVGFTPPRGLLLTRSGDYLLGGPIYHPLSFDNPSALEGDSFEVGIEVRTAEAYGELSFSIIGVNEE